VVGVSVHVWNAKRRFLERVKRLSRTSGYSEQFRRSEGGAHVGAKPRWKAERNSQARVSDWVLLHLVTRNKNSGDVPWWLVLTIHPRHLTWSDAPEFVSNRFRISLLLISK